MSNKIKINYTTFGAGCFWCTEAIFQELNGVVSVAPGYSGGHLVNPTYQQVTSGTTGHVEVVRIGYDPTVISFEELLGVFWKIHDPTTRNRQGADVGTQYRSAVFCHDEAQRKVAEDYKKELDASGVFPAPVVTEIAPLENYYEAEDYHKDYYKLNSTEHYCRFVIAPKVEKFREACQNKLKK